MEKVRLVLWDQNGVLLATYLKKRPSLRVPATARTDHGGVADVVRPSSLEAGGPIGSGSFGKTGGR